jgi:hypothetical protein
MWEGGRAYDNRGSEIQWQTIQRNRQLIPRDEVLRCFAGLHGDGFEVSGMPGWDGGEVEKLELDGEHRSGDGDGSEERIRRTRQRVELCTYYFSDF